MFIYGVISWGIEFQAICIILYIILCKIVAPSHDSRLGLFNRARVKNLLDWLNGGVVLGSNLIFLDTWYRYKFIEILKNRRIFSTIVSCFFPQIKYNWLKKRKKVKAEVFTLPCTLCFATLL